MSVNSGSSSLPLAGVRVLAFTQLGAGPWAMMLLGDLGAEIVKVEDPTTRGDEARTVPPFADAAAHDSLYYQSLNRGARSLTLNLRAPEGRALLHRLVPRVDAVYNNLRGDLPAKLGLDYTALGPVHPPIVCCSLSGFGRTGPRAGDPGYDYLLQAYAGFMSVTGEPDGPPTKSGVSVVDFSGGILSALALMIGLHRARTTGAGGDLDVSLLDTAVSMLNYLAIWTLNRDWCPARLPGGAHQSLVPSQSFATRDGWLVVMCMKQKFWERLAERRLRGCSRTPAFAPSPTGSRTAPRSSRCCRPSSAGGPPPNGSSACAARCPSPRSTPSRRPSPTSRCWRARWWSRWRTRSSAGCARWAARSRWTEYPRAMRRRRPWGPTRRPSWPRSASARTSCPGSARAGWCRAPGPRALTGNRGRVYRPPTTP